MHDCALDREGDPVRLAQNTAISGQRAKLTWLRTTNLKPKFDFWFKKIKKSESPKMISKVHFELLIETYEQFQFFRTLEKKSCGKFFLVIIFLELLEKYHLKLKRRSLFTEIQNTVKSPIVKNSHVTKYYKISYRYNKLKRRS